MDGGWRSADALTAAFAPSPAIGVLLKYLLKRTFGGRAEAVAKVVKISDFAAWHLRAHSSI